MLVNFLVIVCSLLVSGIFASDSLFINDGKLLQQKYLRDAATNLAFPSWVEDSFKDLIVKKLLGETDPLKTDKLARQLLFLGRSTFAVSKESERLLEDEHVQVSSKQKLEIDSFKWYPYEMAAILDFVDLETAVKYMRGMNLVDSKPLDGAAISKTLEPLTNYIIDKMNQQVSPSIKVMSIHAFEVLSKIQHLVNYIPIALSLIPFDRQVFIRVRLERDFLISIFQPSEEFNGISINKSFNNMIINSKLHFYPAPFDKANKLIHIGVVGLHDLVLFSQRLLLMQDVEYSVSL